MRLIRSLPAHGCVRTTLTTQAEQVVRLRRTFLLSPADERKDSGKMDYEEEGYFLLVIEGGGWQLSASLSVIELGGDWGSRLGCLGVGGQHKNSHHRRSS